MKFKILILDLHGLLVDKFPLKEYYDSVANLLIEEGWAKEREEALKTFNNFKENYLSGMAAMESIGLRTKYIDMLNNLPVWTNDDSSFVEYIENIKLPIYIATNTGKQGARKTLESNGFNLNKFKGIITAEDVKKGKPNKEMYNLIMKDSGFKAEEHLVIGDRVVDLIPAEELGMGGILANKNMLRGIDGWL